MTPSYDRRPQAVPPLVAEDHVCAGCDLSYASVAVDEATRRIREIPDEVRAAALEVPSVHRNRRPQEAIWSVVEYVCHLRDVYVTYTIRLHRTRTEDSPVVEPMLNDLRARRFRYNERDLETVLDELALTVTGFLEEIAATAPTDWDRTTTRFTDEKRTARWLVRQALHEGTHHLRDIITVGGSVERQSRGSCRL